MHTVQTTSLLLQASASITVAHQTLLPRDVPSITSDPWQCATVNATQYFDPPKPTGELLTALLSYVDVLYVDCIMKPSCPFPKASKWCAFTKSAPPSLTTAYCSYGSSASSWWSAKSSGASSVVSRCPNTWYKIMNETPGGAAWLNDTIIFSECYEPAHAPTAASTPSKSGISTKKPAASVTTTPTSSSNKVGGGIVGDGMIVAAGTSLVVAAAVLWIEYNVCKKRKYIQAFAWSEEVYKEP